MTTTRIRPLFTLAEGTAEVHQGKAREYLFLELTTGGLTIRSMTAARHPKAWYVPGLIAGARTYNRLAGRIIELDQTGSWRAAA